MSVNRPIGDWHRSANETRLGELGWQEGRNLVTQVVWWNGQPALMRVRAMELLANSPDVVALRSDHFARFYVCIVERSAIEL
jgi:hypothetical protein